MSLRPFRKQKADSDTHAVPATPAAPKKQAAAPKGNIFQRARNYLIESYNGLYKIILSGYVPKRNTFILIISGLLIGMFWAYVVSPTIFYNANPYQLDQGSRDQWIKLVASSYEAGIYNEETVISLLSDVENPAGRVAHLITLESGRMQQALQNIAPLASQTSGRQAPSPGGIIGDLLSFIVPIVVLVIALPLLNLAWKVVVYPVIVYPIINFIRIRTDKTYAAEKQRQKEDLVRVKELREAQKHIEVEADVQLGEPVIKKLSVYTRGRQYDDSIAIEDQDDNFLGECGATIAHTIGDSKEVAAVEIWMFDKEEFQNTPARIFVCEHGYHDPATRSILDNRVDNPDTDIVMLRPGAALTIETQSLRLQAKAIEVDHGSVPGLPPNSHLENLRLQIAVWGKAGIPAVAPPVPGGGYAPPPPQPMQPPAQPPAAAPRPAPSAFSPAPAPQPGGGLRPLSPPPLQPRPAAPPPQPGGGLRPLSPPPMQPPAQPGPGQQGGQPPEDDPFGGTGDFTPLKG